MKKEKLRYAEIDMIRGFTIIILLLYHAGFLRRNGFLEFLEYFNLFGVPLFFFISGLVLTLSYKDNLYLKTYYKRRFQYLLPAYFFWSILTISLVSNNVYEPTGYQAIADILTGDSPGIWFLFVLFQLYLIFPILLKICRKRYGTWLFGIVLSFVSISMILLWNELFDVPFNSFFDRFYFNLIVFQNEFITINLSRLFWFIPFSIYFIMGILIGLNYEQFKEKLLKFKYVIVTIWIALLIMIPIIIQHFDLIYTGYFNVEGIFFGISSIFFFFLIFTQRGSKFFAINGRIAVAVFLISPLVLTFLLIFYFEVGWWSFFITIYLGGLFFLIFTQRSSKFFAITGKIAVAIFLMSPLVLTLLLRFYFPAGWWLSNVAFYLGGLFYGLTAVFFFVLAYKLWGAKFFYFNKKVAVAIFLVPMVVFTIVLSFLPFPLSSTFDFFVLSICSFLIAYLICLNLIVLIKKIPHYEYILTEIKD